MPSIPFEPWELQSYDKSCSLADKSWLLFLFSERPKEVPQRLMTSLNMKIVTNNRPSEFLFLQVTQQMRLLDINHYKPQGAREWNVTGAAGFTDEAF